VHSGWKTTTDPTLRSQPEQPVVIGHVVQDTDGQQRKKVSRDKKYGSDHGEEMVAGVFAALANSQFVQTCDVLGLILPNKIFPILNIVVRFSYKSEFLANL
jgi:hypothetical protein